MNSEKKQDGSIEERKRKWANRGPETPDDIVECLSLFESLREVARRTPTNYRRCSKLASEAVRLGLMPPLRIGGLSRDQMKEPALQTAKGRHRERKTIEVPLPAAGKINKFIFTCAQNETALHKPLFQNMLALLAHYRKDKRVERAELHVSRLTYIKAGLGDVGNKDYVTKRRPRRVYSLEDEYLSYPTEIEPHISDDRLQIAPGLQWCGEVNILPSAARPLSGFESYTGRKSGIFPHMKVAMESIASMPGEGTKINYTTGALTVRNYIARKAGMKADFHHAYGGLLVEVDSDGNWWARQLVADDAGTMYDIDIKVEDGKVQNGGGYVDTIVWGDVHVAIGDQEVFDLCWRGKKNLLDRLRPKRQVLHDVLDFHSRSHHEIKNPMKMLQRFYEGTDSVRDEMVGVREFLETAERDWCQTVVVDSNHHNHLGRWLNSADARFDFPNVEFWAQMWVACAELIRKGEKPHYLEVALELADYTGQAAMLDQDESYVVLPDEAGGIECGLHGDAGPGGAKGSPLSFAKMGRKMVTAHTHAAGIVDGVYTVGTCSVLRPDYVSGPSAWSHTLCLIYENGKRALLTIWAGRERA